MNSRRQFVKACGVGLASLGLPSLAAACHLRRRTCSPCVHRCGQPAVPMVIEAKREAGDVAFILSTNWSAGDCVMQSGAELVLRANGTGTLNNVWTWTTHIGPFDIWDQWTGFFAIFEDANHNRLPIGNVDLYGYWSLIFQDGPQMYQENLKYPWAPQNFTYLGSNQLSRVQYSTWYGSC